MSATAAAGAQVCLGEYATIEDALMVLGPSDSWRSTRRASKACRARIKEELEAWLKSGSEGPMPDPDAHARDRPAAVTVSLEDEKRVILARWPCGCTTRVSSVARAQAEPPLPGVGTPLMVRCPGCRAQRNDGCLRPNGTRCPPHLVRRKAFEDAGRPRRLLVPLPEAVSNEDLRAWATDLLRSTAEVKDYLLERRILQALIEAVE